MNILLSGFLSFSLGFVLGFYQGHDFALVAFEGLTSASCLIVLIYMLTRPPKPDQPALLTDLFWTFLYSAGYGLCLFIAGDPILNVTAESSKLLLFFGGAFIMLRSPKLAHLYIMCGLFFYLGMISNGALNPYDHAEDLSEVAKYIAPPLYILLAAGLGLKIVRHLWVLGLFAPIALYGAILGGARGSAYGAIIIGCLLMLLSFSKGIAIAINRNRRAALFLIPLAALVIPVAIGLSFGEIDTLDDDVHAKSNIERSTMINLAVDSILERPLVGTGQKDGYLKILEYFSDELQGYEATTSLHNQILDYIYFGGILGGACFFLLVLRLFSKLWPNDRNTTLLIFRLSAVLSICMYMAVEPLSAKARTCDLLAVAAVALARSRKEAQGPAIAESTRFYTVA